MLDLATVKDYLAIDYEDAATDRNLLRLIGVAEKYLIGSLGEEFPRGDIRTHEVALIIIGDLFDNHSLTDRVSNNTRKLVEDMMLQIRLEMRRSNGIS